METKEVVLTFTLENGKVISDMQVSDDISLYEIIGLCMSYFIDLIGRRNEHGTFN